MTNINQTSTNITLNSDFKNSVSVTDIKLINAEIIDILKPIYEGEKAQVKLVARLGIAVANWVVVAMSGENTANQLPTLDQTKAHLRDLIKSFVPRVEDSKGNLVADMNEVNKLNSHVLDACKMALLVAGGNTGFIKGVRHESQSLIVPTSQAYDKKGNLKTQLVEDIFWSPVSTFPNKNEGSEKSPVVDVNSSVHRPCTVKSVRECFGVHFEGKKLNSGRYALEVLKDSRDKTEMGFVMSTPDGGLKVSGIKDAINFLTSRFENGDLEMLMVTDNTASKNCLSALDNFIKVYQSKKSDCEIAIKSAIENEKNEQIARQERMKKAS